MILSCIRASCRSKGIIHYTSFSNLSKHCNEDPFPQGHPEKVVVYGRRTTRVEKVLFILEELNVSYERVHFLSPPPAYFDQVNPMRLVPAIRDGPFVLDGSNSICAYLAHKYGQKLGMYPVDSFALGRACQMSDFVEGYLATPRLNHVYHAIVNKSYPPSLAKPGCPSDEEIESSITATMAAMKILNAYFKTQCDLSSTGRPYIASPSHFTFADAAAGPWIHKWYLHANDFGPKLGHKEFEAVAKYYELLAERPAFSRGIQYKR